MDVGELPDMDSYEEVAQQGQAPPLSPAYVPDPMEGTCMQTGKMDLYEEVSQQGQAHLLSPAYVPDPMELDEHVPIYVPEPKYPEYHAPSDDDIQDGDDEPSDDDDDDDDTDDEDEEPTEDEEEEEHLAPVDHFTVPNVNPVPSAGDTKEFEADKSAPTPRSPQTRVPFSQTHLRKARMTVRLEPPMSASMDAFAAGSPPFPQLPTSLTYDQAPLGDLYLLPTPPPPPGCDVSKSSAATRPPRGHYDFVDTIKAGQGLIQSPGHGAWTIARAADRAQDAQVRKRESKDFYTQLHDAQTDRRHIRLEINVVRGQRTTYKTKLHEVRQAYLSSEAQNMSLLS
ncbi:hypothetical protein Tco_1359015 [Tanacetum coccineum]